MTLYWVLGSVVGLIGLAKPEHSGTAGKDTPGHLAGVGARIGNPSDSFYNCE